LVTGSAGFIGYCSSLSLLKQGCQVIGLDNLSRYYDVELKYSRNNNLKASHHYTFSECDLSNKKQVFDVFKRHHPDYVYHMAAQAGVRYSLENPEAYINSNLVGFMNVLEACRHYQPKHLIFASSSSVYGGNTIAPFSTDHDVDHPVSLYAATKKSNELLAHSYSHLYEIPTTGLRFFTVYGPYGRPDMAY